ncbi:MAG: hypothetical protein ACLQME_06185 [Alphaproteobacteria bacterium]
MAVAASDLLFMAGLTGWFWLIGRLPAALLPQGRVPGREFAAPVLGFALFSVIASLLYRFDVPALHLFLAGSALAACGLLLTLVRPPAWPDRRWVIVAAIALATALLMLLPKWIGGAQFFVFQGNIWDQMSYLARSVAYREFSYGDLLAADRTMPLANDFVLFARSELTERPAVSIVHAAASSLASAPPTLNAYVFMVFLQLLGFFALAFVLVSLGACGAIMAAAGGAAFALGFFLQYVFDINAWSELAGLPVMLLAGGSALLLLAPAREDEPRGDAWRLASVVALALAGALYLYPECVPIYAAPLALVALLAGTRHRAQPMQLAAAALVAVLLTLPCWDGTMGVLFRQIHSAVTRTNDWFAYFQRYLIPLDLSDLFTAAYKSGQFPHERLWQVALFVPIDLMSGLFGLYFLQPPPALALVLRVFWRLVVLAGLVALLACAFLELFLWLRRGLARPASRLALWTLLALPTPLPLVVMGKLWAAGKAISMIGPFLFLLAAAPLLLPATRDAAGGTRLRLRQLPALLFIVAQLGFGIARPIAAAHSDGIHYASPPYPSVQLAKLKTTLSWDLAARDDALKRCRRIAVDVENPFLERYVQLHLSELGAVWWSLRPLNSYFGIGIELGRMRPRGVPDCLVTDRPRAVPPGAAGAQVISLARRD